jgi:hypothetical protein
MLPWLRGYAAPAVTRSFTRVFFCKTLTSRAFLAERYEIFRKAG